MSEIDLSKDYRGTDQDVKAKSLILVKDDGTEVELTADDLETLLSESP